MKGRAARASKAKPVPIKNAAVGPERSHTAPASRLAPKESRNASYKLGSSRN